MFSKLIRFVKPVSDIYIRYRRNQHTGGGDLASTRSITSENGAAVVCGCNTFTAERILSRAYSQAQQDKRGTVYNKEKPEVYPPNAKKGKMRPVVDSFVPVTGWIVFQAFMSYGLFSSGFRVF